MHNHKTIEDVLNDKAEFKDNAKAFWKEIKGNVRLEAACILACEAGEWGTEILAYGIGLPFMNEIGILGGIAVGSSYALYHVYKHAQSHDGGKASLWDAAGYAATTESGCIIGATLAEYAAGKFIATTNNPLDLNNIIVRGTALIPAFAIGLTLMSAFTYIKKKEVGRFVSEKDVLKNIKPQENLEYLLKKNKLEIKGKKSNIVIKEKKLPKTYHDDFDKNNSSLYVLQSKICRAKPEYGHVIQEYCEELFKQAGHTLTHVTNIYTCSDNHEEHSHCGDHDH